MWQDPFVGQNLRGFETLRQRRFGEAINDPRIELRFDILVALVQSFDDTLNFFHHPR